MITFLADENISPESADHLEALGYSCHSLLREGPRRISDSEIVAIARSEGRIIITHDLDFGEIYYFAAEGEVGVIVLRLRHQTARWCQWFPHPARRSRSPGLRDHAAGAADRPGTRRQDGLGQAGLDRVEEFSARKMVRDIAALYEELLAQKKTHSH